MSRLANHRWLTLLFLLTWCGFLFFYGLGNGDLWRTESLRAIVAAEFLRTGNWIVPTLYGQPLLTKPPGMYAAIAAVSWPLGGVSQWTARLPSALAATALVFLFFWYFARQLGRTAGLIVALILPMSVMWLDKSTAAEIDMLQVAWVGAAILFFLRGLEAFEDRGEFEDRGSRIEDRQDSRLPSSILDSRSSILDPRSLWWILSLLCVAGGVLTKWSAPAFFYGTVIPLLLWRRQLRLLFSGPHVLGVCVAAGVCLSWVWAAGNMAGWDEFYETFHRELTQHVSPGHREETLQQMSASHHSRLGYWGETLTHPFKVLAMNLPWAALAILALRPSLFRQWDGRGRFLLQAMHCWVWPNLLLWSLLPQHSPRHSFPLFPGIAGLAGLVWWGWMRGAHAKPQAGFFSARSVLVGLVVVWLSVKVVFVQAIVPLRTEAHETRAKGEQLALLVPESQPLYLCRVKDEGIMFYFGRSVQRLADLSLLPSISEPVYCILNEAEWQSLPGLRSADVLWRLSDEQGAPLVLVRLAPLAAVPEKLGKGDVFMGFPAVPDEVEVLTVGQITRNVQRLIEETFTRIWVTGEVSNAKRHSSGHIYLTLKEGSEASLKAVVWRSVAMRLRFEPRDGMEVIARGRLSVYPPQGVYQFNIEELQPKGIGAQELALRQLREKLFKLGYFAPERKKPLPRYPRRIGLVTSATGAAVRDMLEILTRRWPIAEFWICHVRVQGDGAAESIADAVAHLNHLHRGGNLLMDVIILGRGGGSSEDLWAFNEECLAHAIYRSLIPIVSAVGHEIDVTTADMVADVRALTPSQAATLVTPDRAEVLEALADLEGRLRMGLIDLVEHRRRRLDELAGRPAFRMPLDRVRAEEQRLDDWSERLRRAARQRLALAQEKLGAFAGQLESLSPLNVLARGYSLTRKEADRTVVRDAQEVQPGDRLVSIVQHGQIISRVEETHPTTDASASSQGWPSATRMRQA